ncbi:MAG: 3-oxoacid CoA-transferase subunit A [Synergistales bacterium]|jgi:acetate CoA/acetoacetate CoA-transferase alpha subunit|nr:3-oxoacid CoA-transferase subunit A [Bacteroidales bacterium]MBQ6754991.1 3-oxoacid CoA-transferase subunit A [Bacteroidales bacterium]MDY6423833.1 3-oxoacid CoA-transferase subunit A [Bacteroidales bacterium]MDY6435939.1 3-oxoacid CoA-transferase subunit A [Synergistales bacterium]MEE3413099.1 3-oxoacid CoA-transferase subunit A [Bacteroidales bacterium]
MSKRISISEAAAMIKDGSTIMIGGFLGAGSANKIIEEMVKQGKKDLTVICNDTSYVEFGSGYLVANNCVKKVIASHIGTNPVTGEKMISGEMEVQLIPQGTLAEQIRCGGAGIGGFLTTTGLGTIVEEGKQKLTVDGKEYLLEKPLRADVALIGASVCDKSGNLVYRGTSQNFNPLMATAADLVIAEVKEEVEEIAPENVKTPYLFVDYIVKVD